jgi:hypothetical protein
MISIGQVVNGPFAVDHAWRKYTVGRGIIAQSDAQLQHVVAALDPARHLARRLNRRQKQGNQDGNDRDHEQQLDQRES